MLPHSPAPLPPASIDVVEVTLIASGTVDEYTPDRRASIAAAFAAQANVSTDDVEVVVVSASVRVMVIITVRDASVATTIEEALSQALANATAAEGFIGQGVTITAPPQVSARVVSLSSPPAPANPSAPPAGMDVALIGAMLGVLAVLGAVGLCMWSRRRTERREKLLPSLRHSQAARIDPLATNLKTKDVAKQPMMVATSI